VRFSRLWPDQLDEVIQSTAAYSTAVVKKPVEDSSQSSRSLAPSMCERSVVELLRAPRQPVSGADTVFKCHPASHMLRARNPSSSGNDVRWSVNHQGFSNKQWNQLKLCNFNELPVGQERPLKHSFPSPPSSPLSSLFPFHNCQSLWQFIGPPTSIPVLLRDESAGVGRKTGGGGERREREKMD
jgi:hypothetical protein